MAPERGLAENAADLWTSLLGSICENLDLAVPTVRDDLALANRIRRGLPARVIDGLISHGIPEAYVFRWVIPRRTWQRRRQARKALTPDESDRAERIARIFALAEAVFGDRGRAVRWLSSAKQRFDGQTPFDLINSSVGTKIVEDALLQAYYGNVA